MRVLFLHNNFPAQYRHIAGALAARPEHQVMFGTHQQAGSLPGVTKGIFRPARAPHKSTHPYLRWMEGAVLNGQAVYRYCRELKQKGFVPDVVCGHSGWGPTLYVKDVFPEARLLCYFEWYYWARNSDADFLDPASVDEDDACRIRTRNAAILLDLAHCDWGLSPTRFQRSRFPEQFQDKISPLHDGIDTDYFQPAPGARLVLPGLDLTAAGEILTYATRGMEPYRGFPQFMRAAALLLERRPNLHVVVVGAERVVYGKQLPEGQSYRQLMLAELPGLDQTRLHFTGLLPYDQYLRVLQASSAHVYLTVPFVLSWSLLESMATGCAVVGSDTAPVREFISDGTNGLLADFFSPGHLAGRIEEILDHPTHRADLRAAARATICDRYALRDLLGKHVALIEAVAAGRLPPPTAPATGPAAAASVAAGVR